MQTKYVRCANQTLWLCEHLIFLVAGCCVDVLAAIYVLLQWSY